MPTSKKKNLIHISRWQTATIFLSKDKKLGSIVKKVGECSIKPSKPREYFFDLVDSIISQQLSTRVAEVILERVRVEAGRVITPTSLLKIKDENLRKCGLSWAKVKYVKDLAEKVKRGEINLKKLGKLDDEEVTEELIKVKGIGRWTAEMFLMFSLARPDVFPIGDLGIRKGINKLYKVELSCHEMETYSLNWKPYRTAASWYLWRVLVD